MSGVSPTAVPARFDPSAARTRSLQDRLLAWFMDRLPILFAVARNLKPNLRFFGVVFVTRRDDVEQVLTDTAAFQARSGKRATSLQQQGGVRPALPPFGLSVDGCSATDRVIYPATLETISKAMLLDDAARLARVAEALVQPRATAGPVDLGELALFTPIQVAREYYGLRIGDAERYDLALCGLALVDYCFGRAAIDSVTGKVGSGAASRVASVMRASISDPLMRENGTTLIGRLVGAGVGDADIESMLTGSYMAMVGAPAVAVLNVARVLLGRREAMDAARAAAVAGDDLALDRCLIEALRFKPLFPGALRDCELDRTIAAGTWRSFAVKKGDLVLPATQSAMFDMRRVSAPGRFDQERSAADSMVFGFGRHSCLGFAVGRMLLVQILKPLLRRGLSQTRADRSRVTYFGSFRERFPVRLS